jgi:hypothetical protein
MKAITGRLDTLLRTLVYTRICCHNRQCQDSRYFLQTGLQERVQSWLVLATYRISLAIPYRQASDLPNRILKVTMGGLHQQIQVVRLSSTTTMHH